jgi:acetyl esterase/lipase
MLQLRTRLSGVLVLTVFGAAQAAEPAGDVFRNRIYIERESGPLGADLYVPPGKGPFPAVLVVHGGAWTMGSRVQLATVAMSLAQHGYTAATISYRLAPQHPFPAQIYDCQAAVRWLRQQAAEFKIDSTRIGGFGYSAGGQLVALLGTLGDQDFREAGVADDAPSARLQAVVAGGAPCDFRVLPANSRRLAYWLGDTRAARPEAYRIASPAAFISADDPPMFFFHGAQDLLVPISSPKRMVELLSGVGVAAEMRTIQNAGHIEALLDSETLQLALAFVDRYLKDAHVTRGGGDASARSSIAARAGTSSASFDGVAKGGASDGQ